MIKVKIKIADDDVDRLMAASFLVDSHRNIVDGLLTIKDVNVNLERFTQLLDNYTDKYVYYEFLKRNIISQYIPTVEDPNYVIEWTIIYDSCTAIITLESDKYLSEFEKRGFTIYAQE